MSFPTLSSAIVQSLRTGQMHPDLPAALLTRERNKVRVRGEDRHWDYKEKLNLTDAYSIPARCRYRLNSAVLRRHFYKNIVPC
jgi:hypothetical protein